MNGGRFAVVQDAALLAVQTTLVCHLLLQQHIGRVPYLDAEAEIFNSDLVTVPMCGKHAGVREYEDLLITAAESSWMNSCPVTVLLHFMICHSNKCHRPRTSSCHKEQRGGTEYG